MGVIMLRVGAAQTFITDQVETNTETVLLMAENAARMGVQLLSLIHI